MNKKLKKIIFAVTTILFIVGLIEILSLLFFNVFKDRFTFYDINQYLLTDTVIKYAHQKYHPDRGWDNNYNTQFGERPRVTLYNKAYIATFGDSFTYCADVKHSETWQEHLSSLLKRDVYNFGTGGYGTDQAYMKFLEKYPKVKTKIVFLCLITENINRIVNVYRPFYFPKTGLRVTKPRFININGQLVKLKNPIADEQEIIKLNRPKFIVKIGRNDFWYNRNNYPVLVFPYSKILFNKYFWVELIYKKMGWQIDDMNPRPWMNLWEDNDTADIMFKIFKSFIAEAEKNNAIPIIMVIPLKHEVKMRLKTGKDTKQTLMMLEFCRANNCQYFNPIDGFVEYVKNGKSLSNLYKGHMSPKGNQLIANQLFLYLQEIKVSE